MIRTEVVPVQIAEALFDFDVEKLIKYALLLVPKVQRIYKERRQAHTPTRKSEKYDLLSAILDEKIVDDPIAEAVRGERVRGSNEFDGIMSIASIVKDYAAPLVEIAWDPFLTNPFSEKMRNFMSTVERDDIIDVEGWKTIFDRTWADISLRLTGVAHNFVAVRKILNEAKLIEIFEKRQPS